MRKFITVVVILALLAVGAYFAYPKIKGGSADTPQQSADSVSAAGKAQPHDAAKTPNTAPNSAGDPMTTAPDTGTTSHAADNPTADVAALVAEGDSLAKAGKILEARNAYSNAIVKILDQNLDNESDNPSLKDIKAKIKPLNDTIYYDRNSIFEGQEFYTVQSGDKLTTIAKSHKVPYEFIGRANGMSAPYSNLRVGQKLKITNGPFRVLVDLSDRKLYVFHGDYYVREYEVSVGKAGSETPVGKYVVLDKEDSTRSRVPWTDPDTHEVHYSDVEKENFMLGTRWMRITDDGIGIHGRSAKLEQEPLGEAVSHGCIRMRNSEVVELYDMLVTKDSQVEVRP